MLALLQNMIHSSMRILHGNYKKYGKPQESCSKWLFIPKLCNITELLGLFTKLELLVSQTLSIKLEKHNLSPSLWRLVQTKLTEHSQFWKDLNNLWIEELKRGSQRQIRHYLYRKQCNKGLVRKLLKSTSTKSWYCCTA